MRNLVLADVHSNLEALRAVFQDAEDAGGFDAVWCLGDIVGYGPDPGPCIDLLRAQRIIAVAGNHDLAALDSISLKDFNPMAVEALHWTREQLSDEQTEWLSTLPRRLEAGLFTLVHGSPREAVWEYFHPMYTPIEALHDGFSHFSTPYCMVGHSHVPFICQEMGPTFVKFPEDEPYALTKKDRLVVNPGGVGQPRDGDPRASFVIYDDEAGTLVRRRAAYDVEATQRKMRRAGLSEYLVARLAYGR